VILLLAVLAPRIIVLTTYAGDVQVLRALKAGARGYILKGHMRRELLDSIRAVQAGQKRISAEVAAELAEHAAEDDFPAGIPPLRSLPRSGRSPQPLHSHTSR